MSAPTFHFARISSATGETSFQVREGDLAGRFLGTVVEIGGGWQATQIVGGGKARFRSFPDRDAAALWLLSIAPKHGR